MAAKGKKPRRTVVLAVDASEHSERALDWYIKNICDKERDRVILIHAQEEPTILHSSTTCPYDESTVFYDVYIKEVGKKEGEAKKLLDAFGKTCELHGVKFEKCKEQSNKPGEVICKLVEDKNVQLIVMGSRGMDTMRRTFLGSVSDYCVHHAHIPVAIIPPPNRHGDHCHSR